jgi:hypothetical protein
MVRIKRNRIKINLNLFFNFKFLLMKKNRITIVTLAAFVIAALAFVSCAEDDPVMPTPDFTFEIDDKTVTFTNTSADATSYSWDFDDGETSTEANPTHTYAAYGDYDVRLTATNSDGDEIKKTTISVVKEWPAITIDGDFADWAAVPAFYTAGTENGELIEAKVTFDGAAYLSFYVKGTDDIGPTLEIFMDTDDDTSTGWQSEHYLADGSDFSLELIVESFNDGEGDVDPWSSVYIYNPDGDPGWPWDGDLTEEDVDQISGYVGNEVEFRLPISSLPGISSEKIGIYIWVLDNTWTDIGWLPAVWQEPLLSPSYFSFQ